MKQDTQKNKDKVIDALERSLGIVTPACKEVGISRETFYRWYREDINFKKKVDDINEITLDFAENQLLKKIKEGSERSILFYMKYKARQRGYTEDINITGSLDHNVSVIRIISPKNNDIDYGNGNGSD